MQHKLNCIGRLHTPISPVSHGHRAALSDARNARGRVCAWAGSAAARVARSPRFCMWQKLALHEGYPFATRTGADRDDRQKYHSLPPLLIPITHSFPVFDPFPSLMRAIIEIWVISSQAVSSFLSINIDASRLKVLYVIFFTSFRLHSYKILLLIQKSIFF